MSHPPLPMEFVLCTQQPPELLRLIFGCAMLTLYLMDGRKSIRYDCGNSKRKGNANMKQSKYTDYDQLPLFLNAEMAAKLLGISLSSAYELMHEEGFPALRIGNRIVVPKEKFCRWVDRQTGGAR